MYHPPDRVKTMEDLDEFEEKRRKLQWWRREIGWKKQAA
jgi:hypothetical protein